SHGVPLEALARALSENQGSVGGGNVDRAGETTLVQGAALYRTLRDVEQVVVDTRRGVPVRVADLAEVREGRAIRLGAVTAGGEGEVVLGLGFMLLGENSADVTRRLEVRLREAAASLP